jgi:hypothetical protein
VQSGKVQAGWMLHLETIPVPFLRYVPLLEGKWLDRRLVELAEWRALLQAKGYQVQEDPEAHQLAVVKYLRPDGEKPTWKSYRFCAGKSNYFLRNILAALNRSTDRLISILKIIVPGAGVK